MKSYSVGKLKDLEKEGWKIKPADKNAIKAQMASNSAAVAIAVSLENIRSTIENIRIPENSNDEEIKLLLSQHYQTVRDLIMSTQRQVMGWEFDVKRNNQGFIDKVVVTANG